LYSGLEQATYTQCDFH